MIKSFRHKGLKRLYTEGDPSGLRADLVKRIMIRLTRLESADRPEDMNARNETSSVAGVISSP